MAVTVDRRVVLLGGATLVGVGAAAAIIGLRHRSLPREPGLVGHWSFDEGAGDAIIDSSGNGNDGTIFPPGLPDSKWGNGTLQLSGKDNNYVRIAPSESLNRLTSKLSVVARILPRSQWTPGSGSDGFVAVVQRQWRTFLHPDLFYLGYGVENGVQYYKWHLGLVGSEVSLYRLPPGQTRPAAGEWVHLAGTYDSAAGEMALYVNGERIGQQAVRGDIRLDDGSADRPLAIGAELNTESLDQASGMFDGSIDDVRLYDYALSGAQIQALSAQRSG